MIGITSQPTYYYDESKCIFVKEEKKFLRKLTGFGLLVFFIAAIAGLSFFFLEAPLSSKKLAGMKEERSEILERYSMLTKGLDLAESNLNGLYERGNMMYFPIAGIENIGPGFWKGGRGGIDRYSKVNPSVTHRTDIKMEKVFYKISILKNKMAVSSRNIAEMNAGVDFIPAIIPAKGKLLSLFGERTHPVSGSKNFHPGIDFACPIGTPVYATANGRILIAENSENGYGNQIEIDHLNGYITKFAHLSRFVVEPGQNVVRGQVIAYSGNTGMSTGPHVHYEVIKENVKTDPVDFLYMNITPEEYSNLKKQEVQEGSSSMDY